jgi:hypothetical protein
MRLKAIHRKALRDLWHMRGQALAIALVIASGIAMLVMSAMAQRVAVPGVNEVETRLIAGAKVDGTFTNRSRRWCSRCPTRFFWAWRRSC